MGGWQSEREVYTDTHSLTHTHLFNVHSLRRTCDALRALQHFCGSRLRVKSHSIKPSDADLLVLTSTGHEPNVRNVPDARDNMDTSGARFAPIVNLTHDDVDTNTNVPTSGLQFPASANVSVEKFSIGHALTSRRRLSAKCSQSSTDTKSNRIGSSAGYRILKVYLQFLDLKKRFNWSHNELEKPCMISAKRLDVLCSINKDTLLLPPIKLKRLRDETSSTLWQVTMKHTITTCRCKLGNSNNKQTRDSHKDNGICYRNFLRKQIKLLKSRKIFW